VRPQNPLAPRHGTERLQQPEIERETSMKKHLTVLAAFASASAFSQSYVGLSGLVDTALTSTSTTVGGQRVRRVGLYGSGMSSNFLRFDGREDLGGDLYANFRLEGGLNTDSGLGIATNTNNQRSGGGTAGGLTFNRWAYVGLGSKSWGEVRAGRVYTAAFENFTPFDPFLTNGVGSSSPVTLRLGLKNTQTALNVSNAIEYLTPHYGQGFFARATVALGENPSNGTLAGSNPRRGGDHEALRVGYAQGPFAVAFSVGRTHNTAGNTPTGLNPGDYVNTNLAGRWNLGFATLLGQYVTERLEGASAANATLTGIAANEAKTRSFLLGAIVPVGAGHIKFSYVDGRLSDNRGSATEKGRLYALGYDYSFSKRTTVYVAYSHVSNNAVGNYGLSSAFGAPGQGQSSSGISMGVRHTF
jgi:predicted porin